MVGHEGWDEVVGGGGDEEAGEGTGEEVGVCCEGEVAVVEVLGADCGEGEGVC